MCEITLVAWADALQGHDKVYADISGVVEIMGLNQ